MPPEERTVPVVEGASLAALGSVPVDEDRDPDDERPERDPARERYRDGDSRRREKETRGREENGSRRGKVGRDPGQAEDDDQKGHDEEETGPVPAWCRRVEGEDTRREHRRDDHDGDLAERTRARTVVLRRAFRGHDV